MKANYSTNQLAVHPYKFLESNEKSITLWKSYTEGVLIEKVYEIIFSYEKDREDVFRAIHTLRKNPIIIDFLTMIGFQDLIHFEAYKTIQEKIIRQKKSS